jgi:hypothetical protein
MMRSHYAIFCECCATIAQAYMGFVGPAKLHVFMGVYTDLVLGKR